MFLFVFMTLLLLVAPALGGIACGAKEGELPDIKIGDKWVFNLVQDNEEYTATFEVTGEESVDGTDCWVVGVTFDPAVDGMIEDVTTKFGKSTLLPVKMEISGEYQGILLSATEQTSYEFPDGDIWPLKVGNEHRVIETKTESSTWASPQTETRTMTRKVEAKEDVTVAAGTFTCFKTVIRDEDGEMLETQWYSDKVKMYVKTEDIEDDQTQELESYSV